MGLLNAIAWLFMIGKVGIEKTQQDISNAGYMNKVREEGRKVYHDDRCRMRWTENNDFVHIEASNDGSYKIISNRTGFVYYDIEKEGFLEKKKEFEKRTDRFTIKPIKDCPYMPLNKPHRVTDVFLVDKTRDNMVVIPTSKRAYEVERDERGRFLPGKHVYKYYLVYYIKNPDEKDIFEYLVVDRTEITKEEYDHIIGDIMNGYLSYNNYEHCI